MTLSRNDIKRETDLQLISDWIEPGSRILDLGCGRGVLLEHLHQTKQIYGVGVDTNLSKIQSAIKRGLNVYQGDVEHLLDEFAGDSFDWVILSRTVQELERPAKVIESALRVGKRLAVGFVNYGYWRNRWSIARTGERIKNDVYPVEWHEGSPHNPVSVHSFETYCRDARLSIEHVVYLRGDWKTPCHRLPNLRAGYVIYVLAR